MVQDKEMLPMSDYGSEYDDINTIRNHIYISTYNASVTNENSPIWLSRPSDDNLIGSSIKRLYEPSSALYRWA